MSKPESINIQQSSGNVFEDLALPNPEEYLVKAELAYQINQLIKKNKLKQKEAAKLLSVDQPKISALKKGRLTGFSIERLFKFLATLNQDIEIIIKPHKTARKDRKHYAAPHIQVRYVNM